MMQTINLFQAKTHLSKLIDQIASGEESGFIISRNGKPVARVLPIARKPDVSCRIGIAEGEFSVPEDIDGANQDIADLFYGKNTNDATVA